MLLLYNSKKNLTIIIKNNEFDDNNFLKINIRALDYEFKVRRLYVRLCR